MKTRVRKQYNTETGDYDLLMEAFSPQTQDGVLSFVVQKLEWKLIAPYPVRLMETAIEDAKKMAATGVAPSDVIAEFGSE